MRRIYLHRLSAVPLEVKKTMGTRVFVGIKINMEERIRKKCLEVAGFLETLQPWVKLIEKEFPGSHLHHMAVNHRTALETLLSVLQKPDCPDNFKQIKYVDFLDRCLKGAQTYMLLIKEHPEFMKKEIDNEDGYYPDIKGTGTCGSTCLYYSLEAANRMGMI